MNQPKTVLEQKNEDDYAWAIANVVLFILGRLFFTPLPFLILWLSFKMEFWPAMGLALMIGYMLEQVFRRVLKALDA